MTRVKIAFSNARRKRSAALAPLLAIAVVASSAGSAWAGQDEAHIVVVNAGHVVTGTGEEIANGRVVIIDGRIAHVGRNVDYPPSATVIDARDEVVMPGMILLASRHGLPSYSRNGVNAHRTVTDEVYPEQIDFEPLLRAGFTTVCIVPDGTGLPGAAAAYRTAGDDPRLYSDHAYLRVTMSNVARDKRVLRDALKKAKSEIEKVEKARAEWEKKRKEAAEKVKAEAEKKDEAQNGDDTGEKSNAGSDRPAEGPAEFKPPEIDPAHQPLVDLLQKQPDIRLVVELGQASDLLHLDEVLKPYGDLPVVYSLSSSARDFHFVAQTLGERGAKIITGPTMRALPNTVVRHNLVAELFRAGAEVALVPAGSMDRLLATTADLTRSGVRRDEAIRALALNPAAFIGLDEKLGTIAPDKEADLIFLSSDPLDGHARVTRTMIHGEIVWMNEETEP